MYRKFVRKIFRILTAYLTFSSALGIFATHLLAQTVTDTVVIDTSEYVSYDIDFNLMVAANNGYDNEVLRLLNKGADVNAENWEGITPLMFAVQNNHLKVARILLLNNANPNLKPDYAPSALITAVNNGFLQMSELLLQFLANPDITDNEGSTPLMYAAANGDVLMIDMLLYYLVDINKIDNFGNTALHVASYYGQDEAIEFLIEHGALLNATDENGFSPLHCAIQNNHVSATILLIEKGSKIGLKSDDDFTPLASAIYWNRYDITKTLLDSGADYNMPVKSGYYPYNLATDYANDSIIQLFNGMNTKTGKMPLLNYLSLGVNFNASANDLMSGFEFGVYDYRYNFSITTGYQVRFLAKRVLVQIDEDLFYQYWENRSLFYLSANKMFSLWKPKENLNLGASVELKEVLTFGRYRATKEKPPKKFIFVPSAGVCLRYKSANFFIKYEYMDLDVYKISPGRLNFGVNLYIPTKRAIKKDYKDLWHY